MKNKTPSWIDVKKHLKTFDKKQLIALVGDLYRLSSDNKRFFHTRFSLDKDPLESYKRIIQGAIHPYLEDNEILDIETANEAIKSYSKGVDNPQGEAELMESASFIGWGYSDGLSGLYHKAFSDDV